MIKNVYGMTRLIVICDAGTTPAEVKEVVELETGEKVVAVTDVSRNSMMGDGMAIQAMRIHDMDTDTPLDNLKDGELAYSVMLMADSTGVFRDSIKKAQKVRVKEAKIFEQKRLAAEASAANEKAQKAISDMHKALEEADAKAKEAGFEFIPYPDRVRETDDQDKEPEPKDEEKETEK